MKIVPYVFSWHNVSSTCISDEHLSNVNETIYESKSDFYFSP